MSSVAAYPAYPARTEARMGVLRWTWRVGEHEPGGPEPGGA